MWTTKAQGTAQEQLSKPPREDGGGPLFHMMFSIALTALMGAMGWLLGL